LGNSIALTGGVGLLQVGGGITLGVLRERHPGGVEAGKKACLKAVLVNGAL